MTVDGRLSRGTTRKALLLDAAVRIVAEFGANALTHRAVAKGAQVSLASVTYHFPSSAALRSATYEYAGSRIGREFARLVLETASNLEALPDICGDFTARLVTDHRINTITVFEMIVAAGHDPQLSPTTWLLNERLADPNSPPLQLQRHGAGRVRWRRLRRPTSNRRLESFKDRTTPPSMAEVTQAMRRSPPTSRRKDPRVDS